MSSRRKFIVSVGAATLGAAVRIGAVPRLPFHLSVLTDEISDDFGRACEVAAREFGLQWVELRAMHGKNIMKWDAADIVEARKILQRYQLHVSRTGVTRVQDRLAGRPAIAVQPQDSAIWR